MSKKKVSAAQLAANRANWKNYESRLARDYHRTLHQARQVQKFRVGQCAVSTHEQPAANDPAQMEPAGTPNGAAFPDPNLGFRIRIA